MSLLGLLHKSLHKIAIEIPTGRVYHLPRGSLNRTVEEAVLEQIYRV